MSEHRGEGSRSTVGDAHLEHFDLHADRTPSTCSRVAAAAACATIEDSSTITKILAHLGLPTELPTLIPARSPPQPDEFDFS